MTGALAAFVTPLAALDPLSATFNPLSATSWLDAAGPVAVLLVLFAETGLLIGFFLPGDSLHPPVTGHGPAGGGRCRRGRPDRLADRPSGGPTAAGTPRQPARCRHRAGVGPSGALRLRQALVLARFIPVVRTVVNPLAGIAGLSGGRFLVLNLLGGLSWSLGIVLAGYLLGSRVAGIDRYLLPVIAAVVVVSVLPLVIEVLRERRRR